MWKVLVMYFRGVSEAGLSHTGKHYIAFLFVCLELPWVKGTMLTFSFISLPSAQAQFEDPSFTHLLFQINPAGRIQSHKQQKGISDIRKWQGNLAAAMITCFFMEASLGWNQVLVETNISLYFLNNDILIDSTIHYVHRKATSFFFFFN